MRQLLIATSNKGKEKEIRALLRGLAAEIVTPEGIGLTLEVDEDGSTYAENAARKAAAFAERSELVAFADDSGLEVEALGGAPGLYSARYHPKPGASDADRRAYLLKNLVGKPRPWLACFHAAVAVAVPGQAVRCEEGECHGEIIPEERGTGGFGYDAIFLLAEADRTMAELPMEEKNRLSHRARAVARVRPVLDDLFATG